MDSNSPDKNKTESTDSPEGKRCQDIQNLKTYLEQRFGRLPVLPGDPKTVPEKFDFSNHPAPAARELNPENSRTRSQEVPRNLERRGTDIRESTSSVTTVRHHHDPQYFRHPRQLSATSMF